MLLCPFCHNHLEKDNHIYRCHKGHTFDISRSGYVNLLPVDGKHSKNPGDNKLMVESRRAFLDKGYYEPLSVSLNDMVMKAVNLEIYPNFHLLDIGCGEGYYTCRLAKKMQEDAHPFAITGIDISKTALDKASKRWKGCGLPEERGIFAVASAFHLPVAERCCHMVLNLFAPYCGEECSRVLCDNGYMVLVVPGEEHLWELKQAVYDSPYMNQVKDAALEGFRLLADRSITFTMSLEQPDIDTLFKMTPYFYKTSIEGQQRAAAIHQMDVTAAFHLFIYQKE